MLEKLTPKKLETYIAKLDAERSRHCSWFIDNGYGDLRDADLRRLYASGTLSDEHASRFKSSFACDDACIRAYRECERRRAYHGSLRRTPE